MELKVQSRRHSNRHSPNAISSLGLVPTGKGQNDPSNRLTPSPRCRLRAGVTVGAVYSRWPTKTEVMVAALDHIFERLLPSERMKELNVAELPTTAILELWSAHLLSSDAVQDVLIQVFGSARNHPAVRDRLRGFLNDQSDQLTYLIEKGKTEGPHNAELSTVAVTLLCQAIGIGTHLLISAGLDDRHIPAEEEWTELLRQVIGLVYPPPRKQSELGSCRISLVASACR